MKTMDVVIEEELQRQGVKREEIEELNLDGRCRGKNILGLDGCEALKTLSLCHVGLTTLDGFPALPNLTELHLADNKVSSGLGVLSGLNSLKKLNLVHNTIKSMDELVPLAKLNIKWLDLFACPVENTEGFREKVFRMIPSLEVLDNADRTGKENTDSEDESYVESEESESEEEADEADDDDDDDDDAKVSNQKDDPVDDDGSKEADDDSKEAGNDEVWVSAANQDGNDERVDISMLVEGPPVEDSDGDEDYHEDADQPSSEDVDDQENADLDCDDSDTGGGNEPSSVGPSNIGDKKRKREDCNDEVL